jgi:phage FluMu protein Com
LADQECPRGDSCNFLHTPNKRGTQMNAVDRFKEYQSRRPPRKE